MAQIPFLTIYTPTYKRPTLLQKCKNSVIGQSSDNWEHLIIPDYVGIGIDGMFGAIKENSRRVKGEYVYILQDDDIFADEHVVRDLEAIAYGAEFPAVIIAKNIKRGKILPDRWEYEPREGHIDLGSYVVRADVFRRHAGDFGKRYAGDYDFIHLLWRHNYKFFWYDRLIAKAQTLGLGRPERELLR